MVKRVGGGKDWRSSQPVRGITTFSAGVKWEGGGKMQSEHSMRYRAMESVKDNAAREWQPALTGLTARSCNVFLT